MHRHTHLRGFGAVDIDHHFRFVESQVDVDEGKLAGLHCALFHPVHHLQQQRVIVGRIDDELKRQPLAGAGQGGQVEAENLQPGNAFQLGLDLGQDLHLGAAAFVPGLEQEAADTRLDAVEAVDLERGVVLGKFLEDRDELIRIGIQVIQVGRLRRIGHHENDALVLIRCQFRLGEHQQHWNQA
ncbi:hypothetical protein D3C85_688210 [compost metagenome]